MTLFNKDDSTPQSNRTKSSSTSNPKEIRTILGEDAYFSGNLSFEGAVRIDGKLDGEIVSKGTLLVGEKSVIQADIQTESIIIGGKVCGNIIATDRLEMLSNSEICGNIQTPLLKIEEGATFQGVCEMHQEGQQPKSISYVKENEEDLPIDPSIEEHEMSKNTSRINANK
jgi:cytoskeletal protein CcmA (bactofilin family)